MKNIFPILIHLFPKDGLSRSVGKRHVLKKHGYHSRMVDGIVLGNRFDPREKVLTDY